MAFTKTCESTDRDLIVSVLPYWNLRSDPLSYVAVGSPCNLVEIKKQNMSNLLLGYDIEASREIWENTYIELWLGVHVCVYLQVGSRGLNPAKAGPRAGFTQGYVQGNSYCSLQDL